MVPESYRNIGFGIFSPKKEEINRKRVAFLFRAGGILRLT